MGTTLPHLVDRQEEVARIAEALGAAEQGNGQLLLLRGEAGCGKTRLALEAAAEGARRGFATGSGTALAESIIPYHPWREVLVALGLAHILEERSSPKLLGVYVLSSNGEVEAQAERDGGSSAPSPAVAAVQAYVRNARTENEHAIQEGGPAIIPVDPVRAIVQRGDSVLVVAVVDGRESEAFLADLRDLAQTVVPLRQREDRRKRPARRRETMENALQKFLEAGRYEGFDYASADPKLRQHRLFEEIALALSRKASIRPQLVVIDDLQWADPSSLGLLHYIARNTRNDRVLLVGTYRVEEAGVRPHLKDALAMMEKERLPSGLLIAGLPRSEMRRLAEIFLGPHAFPGEFLDLVWRETQGYPLFIRETLRGIEEDGAIRIRGAVKRLNRDVDELGVPQRVREAIRLRLDKLSKEDRRLMDAAAACGTRFTAALLAKVAGEDEARVLPGLNGLARVHGLLRPTENGYTFDHPLVQEVTYDAMTPDAQQSYHLEAAQWLDIVGGPVEDIAEHYFRSNQRQKALPHLLKAANRATEQYANREAARLYQQALDLQMDSPRRLEILEHLGSLLVSLGDYDSALGSYSAALELAPDDTKRATLLSEISWIHILTGEYDISAKVSAEALSLVDAAGSSPEFAQALLALGLAEMYRGEYDRSLELLDRGRRMAENVGAAEILGNCLHNLGAIHEDRGEHEQAYERFEQSLGIRRKLGDKAGAATDLACMGAALLKVGELERARKLLEESLRIAENVGAHWIVTHNTTNLGAIYMRLGMYDRALHHLRQGLGSAERAGEKSEAAKAHAAIGELHRDRGEFDRALERFQESLRIRERSPERWAIPASLASIGFVYSEMGETERALEYLERSLTLREELKDKAGIAAVCSGLAEVHLDRGDIRGAMEAGNRGLAIGKEARSMHAVARATEALGRINWTIRHLDDAILSLQESLALHDKSGKRVDVARVHYKLGLVWKDKGDSRKAKEHLQAAAGILRETGINKGLREVEAALQAS